MITGRNGQFLCRRFAFFTLVVGYIVYLAAYSNISTCSPQILHWVGPSIAVNMEDVIATIKRDQNPALTRSEKSPMSRPSGRDTILKTLHEILSFSREKPRQEVHMKHAPISAYMHIQWRNIKWYHLSKNHTSPVSEA